LTSSMKAVQLKRRTVTAVCTAFNNKLIAGNRAKVLSH